MSENRSTLRTLCAAVCLSFLTIFMGGNSRASDEPCQPDSAGVIHDPNCYMVGEVEITPEQPQLGFSFTDLPKPTVEQAPPIAVPRLPVLVPPLSSPGVGMGDVVNVLKWVWPIIEKNQPVVTADNSPAAEALPKEATDWQMLENWTYPPMAAGFDLVAKNLLGMTLVSLRYEVQWTYGGSFNGKGQYVANLIVVPSEVTANLPYTRVDLTNQVRAILNFGTRANPLAGIQIVVTNTIKTLLTNRVEQRSYMLLGDGRYREVLATESL